MIAHVKYLPHVLLLAGGLALAGCGGSSTTSGAGGDDGEMTPAEKCTAQGTGYTYNEETEICTYTPPEVPKTADDYEAQAAFHISKADRLVTAATKANAGLTAVGSQGISSAVMANAITVRGAPAAIRAEIAKAQEIHDKLAEGEGTAFEEAAEHVEAEIKRLNNLVRDRGPIVRNSGKIGADGKKDDPKTWAQNAGKAVNGGAWQADDDRTAVQLNAASDSSFGTGNTRTLAMVRLDAEPMEGLINTTAAGAAGDAVGDALRGQRVPSNILDGFDAYCTSSTGCEAVAPSGTFGPGWVFIPTEVNAGQNYYTLNSAGTKYTQANFVEWGLWLTEANNAVVINRYIGTGIGSTPVTPGGTGFEVATSETYGNSNKATYKGAAAGLSSRNTGTRTKPVHASGHFVADVELNATFAGATSRIKGTIDNFRTAAASQGTDHVGNWTLSLIDGTEGTPNANGAAWDGSEVTSSDYDRDTVTGSWTAQAYGGLNVANGVQEKRPTGIYGEFNANFSDGKANGVYHTTKE